MSDALNRQGPKPSKRSRLLERLSKEEVNLSVSESASQKSEDDTSEQDGKIAKN